MIIDVSEQLKEPVGSRRHYRVSEQEGSPVEGDIDLTRTERGIYVIGDLSTRLEAVCSRCLVSFWLPLTLRIEEEYLSSYEEGCFPIEEGGEIDLGEAIRQYTVLAMPMKPLCREDCAGLCVGCGQNLNDGCCDCPKSDIDPRLAVLTNLKKESD